MTHPSTAAIDRSATPDSTDHRGWQGASSTSVVRRDLSRRRKVHAQQRFTDTLIGLVTFGALPLDGANDLLSALGLHTVDGDDQVTFRVTAAILTEHDTPARTIRNATDTVRGKVRQMQWTRLHRSPEGYAIDPPTYDPSQPGEAWTTVHTDLDLTVTVPAYRHRDDLITTAYALLAHDLLLLDPDGPVAFRTERIDLMKVKCRGEIHSPDHFDASNVRGRDVAEAAATIRDPRER
jgi:hypothetical protein